MNHNPSTEEIIEFSTPITIQAVQDTTPPVITDYTIQATLAPGAGVPSYYISSVSSFPVELHGQVSSYNPITVNVGDTITMINTDQYGAQHTFSSDGTFDSGTLNPGQSFEWDPQLQVCIISIAKYILG